jgi:hypothetical protein
VPTKRPSGTRSAASSTSRRPEPLVFFLDESLDSDSIAQALTDAGAAVERLTAHLPKGTNDEVWLSLAGKNGWVVLTRDKRRIARICATERGPFVYHIGTAGRPRRMD